MPAGSKKSGTLRKVFKTTPGGRNTVHYEKRNPARHKCAGCGQELSGIPRLRPTAMQNTAKSKKTVERPFGGFLCSSCSRKVIVEETRN